MWPIPDRRPTILQILRKNNELGGLDIVKASRGHLHRGTIYVWLFWLEESGAIKSRMVPAHGYPNGRRVYSLNPNHFIEPTGS